MKSRDTILDELSDSVSDAVLFAVDYSLPRRFKIIDRHQNIRTVVTPRSLDSRRLTISNALLRKSSPQKKTWHCKGGIEANKTLMNARDYIERFDQTMP